MNWQVVIILSASLFLSTNSTGIYSNEGVYSGDERLRELRRKDCVGTCPVRSNLSPVCGSDGKTYSNIDTLNCMDECLKHLGKSLGKASDGFCIDDLPAHLRTSSTSARLIKS